MSTVVYINAVGGERAALVRDGELVELILGADPSQPQSGDICLARVVKDAPSLHACFVDAGFPQHVFVEHPGDASARPRPGHELLIQVRRPRIGAKAAHASLTLQLAGRYLVFSPTGTTLTLSPRLPGDQRDPAVWTTRLADTRGMTIRTAAAGAQAADLTHEASVLRAMWLDIERAASLGGPPRVLHRDDEPLRRAAREWADCDRIVVDDETAEQSLRQALSSPAPPRIDLYGGGTPLFLDAGIEPQIRRALDPIVQLDDGAWIKIEEGETLTAIDVNTGRNLAGSHLARRTNEVAAARIGPELRRRNIGGIVVIDFLKMARAADQKHVEDALRRACAGDPAEPRIFGTSAVGLVELVRPRRGLSLRATYQQPCAVCDESGWVASAYAMGRDLLRQLEWEARRNRGADELVIEAHGGVLAAVVGAIEPAVRDLERRGGLHIRCEADERMTASAAPRIRAVFRGVSR